MFKLVAKAGWGCDATFSVRAVELLLPYVRRLWLYCGTIVCQVAIAG